MDRIKNSRKSHETFCQHLTDIKTQPLTNLSQVESFCVGLQASVAVYVNSEEDAVLFFFVWTAGIVAVNP